jgi:selenocysteine-specific elongation factor
VTAHSLVIGTAGHIDHGKSALVRALTGIDPDRLKEEQARGITIDLGFAHATIDGVRVAFVDVPGHERFVRNMLAGAGGIDAVLLVVAADESVMPQTREHFQICRLLGFDRGVIALSKADLADQDLRGVAAAEVRALVAGSFLAGAPIVPVSARSGEGLDALRAALAALAVPIGPQASRGFVRLPVDRVFTVKGFGAVVTGTLVSGTVAVGDELDVLPGTRRVRVRGLQVHGEPQTTATAPCRLAANLAGVEAAQLSRGVTVASPGSLAVTSQLDVQVTLLPDAPPLKHGARIRVHHGTSELRARIAIAATREADGAWQAASHGAAAVAVPAGGTAFARLRLDGHAVVTRGHRLVLRASSPAITIGGAIVLDPEPPRIRLRRPGVLPRFESLAEADARGAFDLFLREAGGLGMDRLASARRAGLGATDPRPPTVIEAGTRLVHATSVDDASATVVQHLRAFHAAHPLDDGPSRETLRTLTADKAAPEIFDLVMERLRAATRIAGADRVRLSDHVPLVSDIDRRRRDAIESRLRTAGLAPPALSATAAEIGAPAADVDRLVHALLREKVLTRVGDLVFHSSVLATLKAEIQSLRDMPGGGRVDVSTFKERYGLTRKFAIPLLEWLDRERVTRRVGDARVVL